MRGTEKRKYGGLSSWLLLIAFGAALLWMLLLPLTALALTEEERTLSDAYEAGQVIRLHILAEDDSPEAQAIKLAVRDRLLDAFGQAMADAGAQDAEAVYTLLQVKQEEMLLVATQTARELGFLGPVTAQVGVMELPEKRYGQVTLPAGSYRALRITLGSGQGQNWWCVLFPQLCLSLATEEPWQVQPEPIEPVPVRWHSLEILRHWLLMPAP